MKTDRKDWEFRQNFGTLSRPMLASHADVLCALSRVTSPHKERRHGRLFHRRSAQHTKAGLRDQPKERPSLRLPVNPSRIFNSDVKLIKQNKFFRAKFIYLFIYFFYIHST